MNTLAVLFVTLLVLAALAFTILVILNDTKEHTLVVSYHKKVIDSQTTCSMTIPGWLVNQPLEILKQYGMTLECGACYIESGVIVGNETNVINREKVSCSSDDFKNVDVVSYATLVDGKLAYVIWHPNESAPLTGTSSLIVDSQTMARVMQPKIRDVAFNGQDYGLVTHFSGTMYLNEGRVIKVIDNASFGNWSWAHEVELSDTLFAGTVSTGNMPVENYVSSTPGFIPYQPGCVVIYVRHTQEKIKQCWNNTHSKEVVLGDYNFDGVEDVIVALAGTPTDKLRVEAYNMKTGEFDLIIELDTDTAIRGMYFDKDEKDLYFVTQYTGQIWHCRNKTCKMIDQLIDSANLNLYNSAQQIVEVGGVIYVSFDKEGKILKYEPVTSNLLAIWSSREVDYRKSTYLDLNTTTWFWSMEAVKV